MHAINCIFDFMNLTSYKNVYPVQAINKVQKVRTSQLWGIDAVYCYRRSVVCVCACFCVCMSLCQFVTPASPTKSRMKQSRYEV